ncbi:glycosyltransferase family 39 protein [Candidatus Margulisiibacteriota bacterium]
MLEKLSFKHFLTGIIFLLIICFIAFYFVKLGSVPYVRVDEGWFTEGSYILAEKGYYGSPMFKGYYGAERAFHFHPPLHYVLQAGVFKLFGFGILQGRALSLLLALLSLFIFYNIMKLLLPDKERIFYLIPILLLVTTPIFYSIGRTIRPENSVLFFSLLSYLLLLRNDLVKKSKTALCFSGVLSACAIISNISGAYFFLFALIWLFLKDKKGLIVFLCGFAIPSFLYLLWIISDWPAFYGQVILQRSAEVKGNVFNMLWGFIASKTKVTVHFLFLISILAFAYIKNKRIFDKKYFTYYLLPFITFALILPVLPHINPLYFIVILPFVYLNFSYIYTKLKTPIILTLLMVMILVINCYGIYMYYGKYHDYDYNRYINRLSQKIPEKSNILGIVSLYPGLHKKGDYTLYAFENARFSAAGNYSVLKQRINEEYKINYIILDAWISRHKFPGLEEFLKKDTVEHDRFISPDYGSEGEKRDNLIRIYKIVR